MSKGLDIILQHDGVTLCHPREPARQEFVFEQDDLARKLREFCQRHAIAGKKTTLYLAEELLFVKIFDLPTAILDLEEAISYQLRLLTPFTDDEILHSFAARKEKDKYFITLIASRRQAADACIREIVDAGYTVAGLYPESQRYVNTSCRKLKWALLFPGDHPKVLLFKGTRLIDRFLCRPDIDFKDLAAHCGTETIYHLCPPRKSKYLDAGALTAGRPLLQEFNLLPATYQRPDYTGKILLPLVILNLIALAAFAGLHVSGLIQQQEFFDREIARVLPKAKKVNTLHSKEKQLAGHLEEIALLGRNPDLISFLENLTAALPNNSYLDQVRFDRDSHSVTIQGYTDDISGMTAKLQEIGETKLKSTSRRRDKIYFVVEINLP